MRKRPRERMRICCGVSGGGEAILWAGCFAGGEIVVLELVEGREAEKWRLLGEIGRWDVAFVDADMDFLPSLCFPCVSIAKIRPWLQRRISYTAQSPMLSNYGQTVSGVSSSNSFPC